LRTTHREGHRRATFVQRDGDDRWRDRTLERFGGAALYAQVTMASFRGVSRRQHADHAADDQAQDVLLPIDFQLFANTLHVPLPEGLIAPLLPRIG